MKRLGEGGMGVVYEAEQQHPRRPVALKQIRGGAFVGPQQVKLFEREVQALARLKHPGIAAIYEAGRTPAGQHFFAMELVRGETLTAYAARMLATTSDPSRECLQLFLRVCDAVNYAHQRGVIHRDLKPANIMITGTVASTRSGQLTPEIKVLDFGLARITDADLAAGTIVSEVGRIQGTLAYMSPEQVRGNPDEIDLRTDVYSLGIILYELVTGSLPYDVPGASFLEAARVICEQDPKPPERALNAGVRRARKPQRLAPDLGAILMKALEKEPRRRYQSASGLAEDVERFLHDEPISARAQSAAYYVRKLMARHKLPFAFAGALVLVLATFAIAMGIQSVRLARERDRARLESETSRRVTDFMVDLFHISDPSESRGNSLTAREVLDRGVARLESELKGVPAVHARLQHTIGKVYTGLGLYKEARPQLEAALATRRQQFGERSLEAAQTLYELAQLADNPGSDKKEMERWSRESLAIRRERLGDDDLDVAASLRQAGVAIADASDDPDGEGERFLQQSLVIRRHRLGVDHALVADSLFALGYVISYIKRDIDRGESFIREALAMRRRLLGNDHPHTLASIQLLANHVARKGDYAGAMPLYREEIVIGKKTLGPTHPLVAMSMNDLMLAHNALGEFDAAEQVALEALALLGAKHPDVATLVSQNLSRIKRSKGDKAGAEALLRTALDGSVADWSIVAREESLVDLAHLLNERANHNEALRRADEAIAKSRETGSRFELAAALYEKGNALLLTDRRQSEHAYVDSVEILRGILARAKVQQTRLIGRSETLLGGCLVGLRRYAEAEPLLLRSYASLRASHGPHDALTREARARITQLYEAVGQRDKAAEYR